jgi:hypothetical protein
MLTPPSSNHTLNKGKIKIGKPELKPIQKQMAIFLVNKAAYQLGAALNSGWALDIVNSLSLF